MSCDSHHCTVTTYYGKVRGSVKENYFNKEYYAFTGIEYAHIAERFSEPTAPNRSKEIFDATKEGPICPQINAHGLIEGEDDCLNLNVFTKNLDSSQKQPVIVWFHGGGFQNGYSGSYHYAPDFLIEKDVILVTVNYRFGVFGFLNLEDSSVPANLGLKDQLMALYWVKHNIEFFGGDRKNVTIGGDGSGAACAHFLSIHHEAEDSFHKVILMGGTAMSPWSLVSNPKLFALRLCRALGEHSEDTDKIIKTLKKKHIRDLVYEQDKLLTVEEKMKMIWPFGPGLDEQSKNPFMPKNLELMLEEGINAYLLVGHCSKEGAIFSSGSFLETGAFEQFDQEFHNCFNPRVQRMLDKISMPLYYLKDFYCQDEKITINNENFVKLLGDVYTTVGIHMLIKAQNEKRLISTYMYQYDFNSGKSFVRDYMQINNHGAVHGEDVWKIFNSTLKGSNPPDSAELSIINEMTEMWANFARQADPTPTGIWEEIQNSEFLNYLEIGSEIQMKTTRNLLNEYFDFKLKHLNRKK